MYERKVEIPFGFGNGPGKWHSPRYVKELVVDWKRCVVRGDGEVEKVGENGRLIVELVGRSGIRLGGWRDYVECRSSSLPIYEIGGGVWLK